MPEKSAIVVAASAKAAEVTGGPERSAIVVAADAKAARVPVRPEKSAIVLAAHAKAAIGAAGATHAVAAIPVKEGGEGE